MSSTTYACRGTDPATGKRCTAIATRHVQAYYRGFYGEKEKYTLEFLGCRPCADKWHQRQVNEYTDRIVAQPITDYDKGATVHP